MSAETSREREQSKGGAGANAKRELCAGVFARRKDAGAGRNEGTGRKRRRGLRHFAEVRVFLF